MPAEVLIQHIEVLLAALKSGDESALSRLFNLLDDQEFVERIAGDQIRIDNISQSQAVAIGRGARALVYQRIDLPQQIIARLVALADVLEMQGVVVPPPLPDEIPQVDPRDDGYIFVSYARPDQPIAEAVEAYLMRAGFRVFRDSSVLRNGANWDMGIEYALRETHRMVLLLSEHSMPYRKEVHREWFFFDQNHKPIHPIYLANCDLHSRLYAYKYLSVGNDLYSALSKLAYDLTRPFEPVSDTLLRDRIIIDKSVAPRPLPEAMQALLDTLRGVANYAVLSPDQVTAIIRHHPTNLTEYHLARVAEWSQPKYRLDDRFVSLTLLINRGDWRFVQQGKRYEYHEMRDVLFHLQDYSSLVLLGEPGSGKSTLLRRLQLDDSIDQVRGSNSQRVSFLISLNNYRSTPGKPLPMPLDWLADRWHRQMSDLPSFTELLDQGRVLLLLDGLNEMPHASSAEYAELVALWRQFIADYFANGHGNQAVISCRTLDYSALLDGPQVEIQKMSSEQVWQFLNVYLPTEAEAVWTQLHDTPQLDLFRNPYFLKLLIDQVNISHSIPRQRAELFTGLIRHVLWREIAEHDNPLLRPNTLFTERDRTRLALQQWASPLDLPERGILIPSLSDLAYRMQASVPGTDAHQVAIHFDTACRLLDHERNEDILRAGCDLSVLDENPATEEIRYFHQLLQEYFAARRLVIKPDFEVARVEWQKDRVKPSLDDIKKKMRQSSYLPTLPTSGWEETVVLATQMSKDPDGFIKEVATVNLPLAARCSTSEVINIDQKTKDQLRHALIIRMQEQSADIRARVAAGLALGQLGDNREGVSVQQGHIPDIDWVKVPSGSIQGIDGEVIHIKSFWISRYPVTWEQFMPFWRNRDAILEKYFLGARTVEGGVDLYGGFRKHSPNEAIAYLNGYEAHCYCRWLSDLIGYQIRLPVASEWRYAFLGSNVPNSGMNPQSIPEFQGFFEFPPIVGMFPELASPFGIMDMGWPLMEMVDPFPFEGDDDTATGKKKIRNLMVYLHLHRRIAFSTMGLFTMQEIDWPTSNLNSGYLGFRLASDAPILT